MSAEISDRSIIGANSHVRIGQVTYDTKATLTLNLGPGQWYKDATPAGIIKHPGLEDNNFDAEIFVQRNQLGALLRLSQRDNNNRLPRQTITLTDEDFTGNNLTISGTGSVGPIQKIDASGDEKVIYSIHVEYYGSVTISG